MTTLSLLQKLEKTGIPREQADAIVEVIQEGQSANLATKSDLKELELTLKNDILLKLILAVSFLAGLMAVFKFIG